MELTEKELLAKNRICLALDVPATKEAFVLVNELSDLVGLFKIGKELHISACNESFPIIQELYKAKGSIFLDLKLHDTPNTVYKASKALTVPGVYMFNLHIAGGEEMCKKAVEAAYEQSNKLGIPRPKVIGVTILTSLNENDLLDQGIRASYDELILRRTELAKNWGLDGIVCPANKAGIIEKRFQYGSNFLYITPGISFSGKCGADQKQLYTPEQAVKDCSNSILVIGSSITKAEDKRATAHEIIKSMAEHI